MASTPCCSAPNSPGLCCWAVSLCWTLAWCVWPHWSSAVLSTPSACRHGCCISCVACTFVTCLYLAPPIYQCAARASAGLVSSLAAVCCTLYESMLALCMLGVSDHPLPPHQQRVHVVRLCVACLVKCMLPWRATATVPHVWPQSQDRARRSWRIVASAHVDVVRFVHIKVFRYLRHRRCPQGVPAWCLCCTCVTAVIAPPTSSSTLSSSLI